MVTAEVDKLSSMSNERWFKLDSHLAGNLSGDALQARRAGWRSAADNVILPTLRAVLKSLPNMARRIYIEEHAQFDNFSSVQLWFGRELTGIGYRRERDGKVERAVGTEEGAALLFSQSETGHIVPLAYTFRTELPEGAKAGGEPWLGPKWSPEAVTKEAVEEILEDFLRFTVTTSIYWKGGPAAPKLFRRPPTQQDIATHANVEEILRSAQRAEAFNQQVVAAGIAQTLVDLERLTAEVDERELEKFLEGITPSPRLRRVVGKWLEEATRGLVGPDDLRPR